MPVMNSYVYGSTAEKLNYEVKKETKQAKNYKIEKNKRIEEKIEEVVLISRGLIAFAGVLAFSLCFLLIYRYALITEMNYKLNSMQREYDNVISNNMKLIVDIGKQVNLDRVHNIATNELGMHKPDKYQVKEIYVPKISYMQFTKNDNIQENDNIIKAIVQKVNLLAAKINIK